MHHGNGANYSCEIRVGCLNKRPSLFSGASLDGLWLEEPSIRKDDLPYASEHLNTMSGNLRTLSATQSHKGIIAEQAD